MFCPWECVLVSRYSPKFSDPWGAPLTYLPSCGFLELSWPICASDILKHSYLQMEFFFFSFKTKVPETVGSLGTPAVLSQILDPFRGRTA